MSAIAVRAQLSGGEDKAAVSIGMDGMSEPPTQDALQFSSATLQASSAALEDGISVDLGCLLESRAQNTLQESSAAPDPQTIGATASKSISVSSASQDGQRDLDQEAMDRVLTMCKSPSVLQDDVLRGAPLSFTLRRFGSLWRTSPLDRTPATARKLWAKSRKCDGLDAFLSHAWQSPGWQKYLSLLLIFYSAPAMCGFVLASLLLFALDLNSFLPTVAVHYNEGDGNMIVLEFCPWATIPVWVCLLALFAGPSSRRCVRDWIVFFDAVCINQVDDDLKRAGVYSLSGILAKSDQLTVLWSPPYLSRRWCVYELATYAAIRQDGRIEFRPMFKYLIRLAGFFGITIITGNGTLSLVCGLSASNQVGVFLSIIPFTIMVSQWLPLVRAQKQLMEQLTAFRIENTECREEKDRAFILQSIQQLYGSEAAFNAYVRGPLKDRISESLPAAGLTYPEVLGMCAPLACHFWQWIAAYARQGLPWAELGDYALKVVANVVCFCPLSFKLTQLVISRSAAQHPSPCADATAAVRASLAMYSILFLIIWAQWAGPHWVPMFGLWWLIGGGALTGLTFYLDSPHASKWNRDRPASVGGA